MSTRRERMTARMERRLEWAKSREAKAAQHFAAADPSEENTGIPLGQPVLVGHHSEKRHRRTLDRLQRHMEKASESADMAKHHESKAFGIAAQLNGSVFSDDPDALEALADRQTALEVRRDWMKAGNAYYKARKTLDGWDGPEDVRKDGESVLRHQAYYGKPFPPYAFSNLSARIRADMKRAKTIEHRQERAAKAEAAPGGVLIVGQDYINVTFAEKPDRVIINALKARGFRWGGGTWGGYRSNLPTEVLALIPEVD